MVSPRMADEGHVQPPWDLHFDSDGQEHRDRFSLASVPQAEVNE